MFGWIKNLKKGLNKSSKKINEGLTKIFKSKKINEETLDELQDLLITSDIGISVSDSIIDSLRKKKLNDIKSPVLVMHGKKDNIVPFYMGERLFKIANKPKKFLQVEEDDHMLTYNDNLLSEINKFISKY